MRTGGMVGQAHQAQLASDGSGQLMRSSAYPIAQEHLLLLPRSTHKDDRVVGLDVAHAAHVGCQVEHVVAALHHLRDARHYCRTWSRALL